MVKEISKIRLLAAVALLILGSLFTLDWRRKQGIIDAAYQDLAQVQNDLHDFVDLGFDKHDEAMQLLQKREVQIQSMIAQLKRDWFTSNKLSSDQQDQLDRLISLHKKMMHSSMRDMREFSKLGCQNDEAAFQFAHDSLEHLIGSLRDVKRRCELAEAKKHDPYNYAQEMRRMITINQHIIDRYKKALSDFKSNVITLDDEQVALIKKNITQRLRTIDALQDLVA